MTIDEFPRAVTEHIGYYVYTLADSATKKVFYVGKGTGNRVFGHVRAALERPDVTDKLDKIRQIHNSGALVLYEIVRHGMTEDQAFEVEAALIDYIGLPELKNAVAGHDMDSRGRMTIAEIIAKYQAEPITISESALLIIVNRLFERNISPDRLYEITRGNWVLGERRNHARYALSVYHGIVRQVYRVDSWEPVLHRGPNQKIRSRWRFKGPVAHNLQHYVGGSVAAYITRGAQSPVKYVNC
jgi:hypothetical protein